MLPAILMPGMDRENWKTRREALVELFREQEYGRRPDLPYRVESRLVSTAPALEGNSSPSGAKRSTAFSWAAAACQ